VILVEGRRGCNRPSAMNWAFSLSPSAIKAGVAKGLFTEEAVAAVNGRMEQLLLRVNLQARIDRQEFCPFHPQAIVERYRIDSDLRKPKPGMILLAPPVPWMSI